MKNTYFAKKIDSDTTSWPVGGLKHFGQSQGGLPPPTQLTNTKNTMSNTSRLSRAIYYDLAHFIRKKLILSRDMQLFVKKMCDFDLF